MSERHGLRRLALLALVAAGGIVGMLLADGLLDIAFFLLAALPLAFGGWRAFALRGVSARRRPPSTESLP